MCSAGYSHALQSLGRVAILIFHISHSHDGISRLAAQPFTAHGSPDRTHGPSAYVLAVFRVYGAVRCGGFV